VKRPEQREGLRSGAILVREEGTPGPGKIVPFERLQLKARGVSSRVAATITGQAKDARGASFLEGSHRQPVRLVPERW
jgi:hypothetical protein